jgi:gas vesicle protein
MYEGGRMSDLHEGDIIVEEEDNGLPYLLLGIGLGVVAGILFAPQSGEKTRRMIREKAEDSVDFVKRRSAEFQETATDAIERGKKTIQRRKDTIAAAVEAGRQAYREAAATEND